MDANATLQLLFARRLKCTPRTGWVMRGWWSNPLDKAKTLTVALFHDLPESAAGDIPSPATAHFPPETKRKAEAATPSESLRFTCLAPSSGAREAMAWRERHG